MSDTARLCLIMQAQSQLLSIRIAAESTKEYKADWLKNADTVVRDGTGKFAKKSASVAQSVQDTTAILKQGFDLTTDTIQSLVKDPDFRKRAGLAAGLPMAKLISNLATQARLNPKLTEKLDEWIANATKEFADQYGDDKSPMAQAIRKANLAQPPKDASLNEKMEFRVAQFAAYKEALESPEDYSKRDEIIGKAATAAIPIGVSLAIALGFEVAIPLFMAQGVNWTTVLSSVAIGEAADFAVQKGMDKLEINNPVLRIGASMVAGILAGGLVTTQSLKVNLRSKLEDSDIRLQEIIEHTKEVPSFTNPFLSLDKKEAILDYPKYRYAEDDIDIEYKYKNNFSQVIKISNSEIDALNKYTKGYSTAINQYLRGNTENLPDHLEDSINLLVSALNKIPRFTPEKPMVRYEGSSIFTPEIIERFEKLKEGEMLTTKSFLSVTPEPQGTGLFCDGQSSLKYIIHPHKESLARNITQFNVFGEAECLYQPGTQFRVLKKYTQKVAAVKKGFGKKQYINTMVVELEEYSAT